MRIIWFIDTVNVVLWQLLLLLPFSIHQNLKFHFIPAHSVKKGYKMTNIFSLVMTVMVMLFLQ